MAWIYLLAAGLLECGWAIGLKYTESFTRPLPTLLTVATMASSFFCLTAAMKSIPAGTAYAVWTGIGAVGARYWVSCCLARRLTFTASPVLCWA